MRVSAGLPELRDAAAEIEWAKVTQVRPDDFAAASAKAGRTPPFEAASMARIYASYEELRTERHVVDFESVLELTAGILAEYPAAARSVRDRYACFVVDEYQDVNPLQKLLLDMWLGGRDEICVVGDPRQTIYSFTGRNAVVSHRLPGRVPVGTCHPAGAELPLVAASSDARQQAGGGHDRLARDRSSRSARPVRRRS